MGNSDAGKSPGILPLPELLRKIKDGTIKGRDLPPLVRQECVEALIFEGFSNAQIQSVIGCADRMLRRDIEAICRRNALLPSAENTQQLMGEYLWKVRMHHASITRLARTKDTTPYQRAQMEAAAFQVIDRMMERLQFLGILPNQGKNGRALLPYYPDKLQEKERKKNSLLAENNLKDAVSKLNPVAQERLLKVLDNIVAEEQVREEKRRRAQEGE